MNRDVRICCRTTKMLRKTLEVFARREKRSLSSALELILTDFFKDHQTSTDHDEKRRFRRKPLSIPALVRGDDSSASGLESAVILDLSLGGLSLSVSKESSSRVGDESRGSQFEAAFVLPDVRKPIRILCKRERVEATDDGLRIGASFTGADFDRYQQLQQYLLQ